MHSSAVCTAELESEVVWREVWAQTLRLGQRSQQRGGASDLGHRLRLCVRCCLVLSLGISAAAHSERRDISLGRRDEVITYSICRAPGLQLIRLRLRYTPLTLLYTYSAVACVHFLRVALVSAPSYIRVAA